MRSLKGPDSYLSLSGKLLDCMSAPVQRLRNSQACGAMAKLKLAEEALFGADRRRLPAGERKRALRHVPQRAFFLIHHAVRSVWEAGMQAEPLYIRAYEGQKAAAVGF